MTFRMKVPDAPKDLWRTMLAIITKDETKLNMEYWHAFTERDAYGSLCITSAETKKEVACSTVHCMAGWVDVITPGGVEFEDRVRKKLEKDPDFIDDCSDYVQKGDNEVSTSALLILEKAGWDKHINMRDFTSSTDEQALNLVKKLAKVEARREARA